MAGKSDCNMDLIRSHTEVTMKGRFIVSYFSLSVLSELRRRMREPMYDTKSNGEVMRYKPVGDEMSFWELMYDSKWTTAERQRMCDWPK